MSIKVKATFKRTDFPSFYAIVYMYLYCSFLPHFQAFFPVPKLLKHALFFMKDRLWKQTRNVLTPAFSAGKLKQVFVHKTKTKFNLLNKVKHLVCMGMLGC